MFLNLLGKANDDLITQELYIILALAIFFVLFE